ncbi:CUE domain-containing protein [Schizosaccharomyces pombe]|uniref:CUE domain-containing protein 5 n=1 Tax=Schizosaccharomyces pombe (strain 972 / ATCC 24843) TaxID=284812 RepID=CUE5_SCHPO|nr:CUE domain protein [Schizosaccharomyces pombe]O14319.1 RecName: Full=CUE domain-containing protein 5 [Schizosaccharomyces pombe 972h-]CAB16895.1 CUE domain protein [Schizosaccharomyces pombe]|eukprot:NP_595784.1 CUE domain protein [Schizosaccharomyces pombe]
MASEQSNPRLPRRPPYMAEKARATLKEAFPNTDDAIIRAVLAASGYKLEPAFNALLGLSDPQVAEEMEQAETSYAYDTAAHDDPVQRQLEEDERCARELANRYNSHRPERRRKTNNDRRNYPPQNRTAKPNDNDGDDYSFFEDDLPVIKDTFMRGFQSFKQRSMEWVENIASKFDGEEEDDDDEKYSAPSKIYPSPRRSTAATLESAYEERPPSLPRRKPSRPGTAITLPPYESDPHMLNEKDFERLRLESSSSPMMRRSSLNSNRRSVESSSSAAFVEGQSFILDSNGAIEVANSAFALDDSDLESAYNEELEMKKDTSKPTASTKEVVVEKKPDESRKQAARTLETVSEEQMGSSNAKSKVLTSEPKDSTSVEAEKTETDEPAVGKGASDVSDTAEISEKTEAKNADSEANLEEKSDVGEEKESKDENNKASLHKDVEEKDTKITNEDTGKTETDVKAKETDSIEANDKDEKTDSKETEDKVEETESKEADVKAKETDSIEVDDKEEKTDSKETADKVEQTDSKDTNEKPAKDDNKEANEKAEKVDSKDVKEKIEEAADLQNSGKET